LPAAGKRHAILSVDFRRSSRFSTSPNDFPDSLCLHCIRLKEAIRQQAAIIAAQISN